MSAVSDALLGEPPLAIYVHLPWCLSKCPYCDFNSHALVYELPESTYIESLLTELRGAVELIDGRTVQSVYLGGGTPSLFTPGGIGRIVHGIRDSLTMADAAEISMEVNPGAREHGRLAEYSRAGINRFSLGVQSFDSDQLERLGRIHEDEDVYRSL